MYNPTDVKKHNAKFSMYQMCFYTPLNAHLRLLKQLSITWSPLFTSPLHVEKKNIIFFSKRDLNHLSLSLYSFSFLIINFIYYIRICLLYILFFSHCYAIPCCTTTLITFAAIIICNISKNGGDE